MNDDSWLALLIGTKGRSSTNSWLLSSGSCIIRYSGLIGLLDPASVELRPPLSPPTGAAVTPVPAALAAPCAWGLGAMSHNAAFWKNCGGSVMWYCVYCSVWVLKMSWG